MSHQEIDEFLCGCCLFTSSKGVNHIIRSNSNFICEQEKWNSNNTISSLFQGFSQTLMSHPVTVSISTVGGYPLVIIVDYHWWLSPHLSVNVQERKTNYIVHQDHWLVEYHPWFFLLNISEKLSIYENCYLSRFEKNTYIPRAVQVYGERFEGNSAIVKLLCNPFSESKS